MSILNKKMPLLSGDMQDLSEYQGKVVLVVNRQVNVVLQNNMKV